MGGRSSSGGKETSFRNATTRKLNEEYATASLYNDVNTMQGIEKEYQRRFSKKFDSVVKDIQVPTRAPKGYRDRFFEDAVNPTLNSVMSEIRKTATAGEVGSAFGMRTVAEEFLRAVNRSELTQHDKDLTKRLLNERLAKAFGFKV